MIISDYQNVISDQFKTNLYIESTQCENFIWEFVYYVISSNHIPSAFFSEEVLDGLFVAYLPLNEKWVWPQRKIYHYVANI